MGGAALAAPFLTSIHRPASAQAAAASKRLVIFYTQNGCLTNRWFPTVENGDVTSASLMGTTLEPLAAFAPQLLFPRGLAMYPKGTINGYFDPHDQGMGSKLTAAPLDPAGSHWAQGKSLDHVLAEMVNPAGTGPLVLSVGSAFANVKGIISYSDVNTPYSPETNPSNVFKTLAAGFGTGGTTTPAPTTVVDYKVAQGNSIIDLVKGDLDSFKRLNMSKSDQTKVDAWLSLVRETEMGTVGGVTVSAACTADAATGLGVTDADVKAAQARDTATAFTKGGDMMLKLIALTMMCDTNRVIILQWPGFVTFKWDGMDHQYDHHGLSHRNGTVGVGGTCAPGVLDSINQIDQWYAKRYSQLVTLVSQVTEGDGTMLDNSAVMWLPELADGNAHNNNNLPIVIAGSAGGYLKQGLSVDLDTKTLGTGNSEASCANGATDVGYNTGSNTGNVPLNKLFVTLMNAVGAKDSAGGPITQFGVMDTSDVSKGITQPGELDAIKA
jgi:hypothetical protein